jgi:anti-sigma B factor antagonist
VAYSVLSMPGYTGCAVLALGGELDITDGERLSSQLAAVVAREPWVIVDLAGLAFIDCSSFRVLAGARDLARAAGGDVLLAGPRGSVARLLMLTGWGVAFPVFPSVELAASSARLAAFGGRRTVPSVGESLAV